MSSEYNGIRVVRRNETIFIPLPREAWESCGQCDCSHCQGQEGYWDTLAVGVKRDENDTTWTVHAPEFQATK